MDNLHVAQSRKLIEDSLALLKHNAESVQDTVLHMQRSVKALETSKEHLALVEQHQSSGIG